MSSKTVSAPEKKAAAKPAEPQAASKVTKLLIKIDCGYGNKLTIRGEGAGLTWSKGLTLKNISANEWLYETSAQFNKCEFKILLNDEIYEAGPNRVLVCGTTSSYTPKF